jgi:serine/threonine-protein kinase RsbW
MDETAIADLKTVVTEAAMNVVVHAYPEGDPGLLSVEAVTEDDGLTVEVRDYGMGIRPRPDATRPSLRIGLTLIAALSSSFEISGGARRGTVIRMHLPIGGSDEEEPDEIESATLSAHAAPAQTEVRVGPPHLLGTVLSRVLGALAARQNISVDRLSDTMLLSDAISAGAPVGFDDGSVSLSIAERSEGVILRVGPMVNGAAERLQQSLELPSVGSLATLADDLHVDRDSDGEYLVVAISSLSGSG